YWRGAVAEVQCRVAVGHGIWLQAAVTGGPAEFPVASSNGPQTSNQREQRDVGGLHPAGQNVPQVVVAIVQQQVEGGNVGGAQRIGACIEKSFENQIVLQHSATAAPAQTGEPARIDPGFPWPLAGRRRRLARRRKR